MKLIAKEKVISAIRQYEDWGCPATGSAISAVQEVAQIVGKIPTLFKWENECYEVLAEKYPNCKSAIKWWTSNWGKGKFDIRRATGLKEFLIAEHPPLISDQCCEKAKKNQAKKAIQENGVSLNCVGVRQSENGVRSFVLQSCFTEAKNGTIAQFRPIFYFSDADKQEYKEFCGVTYSDCYEVWGLKRTGCACCPFGSKFEDELEVVKQYEPKLYAAACKIFGPSYEYTRKYRKFKEAYKRERRRGGQIDMFDDPYAKEVDPNASDK